MTIISAIGPAALSAGTYSSDEQIKRAKVDVIGSSPNAKAKLYQWVPAGLGGWEEVDRMTQATIDQRGEIVKFTGRSEMLITQMGLNPEDAEVSWTVTAKGCDGCR